MSTQCILDHQDSTLNLKAVTSWLVLGRFLYAVTIVLKRRSTLFTLHMAYMAHIINCKNNEAKTRRVKQSKFTMSKAASETGYLVKVTISNQLVLMLQSVLEQGPYDGLQFRVGGQQVGAEHLQPHVSQPVHCRDGRCDSFRSYMEKSKLNQNRSALKKMRVYEGDQHLTFLIEQTERI